jgi:hypothetical protein
MVKHILVSSMSEGSFDIDLRDALRMAQTNGKEYVETQYQLGYNGYTIYTALVFYRDGT